MSVGRIVAWSTVALVLAGALGAAVLVVPRWLARSAEPATAPAESAPPLATRHIRATLLYVSEDGLRLVPVQREVPFGEGVVEQARRLVEAQLEAPAAPLLSALPAGTRLRALFVSERGEAFVDLSSEVSSAHPGGALNELLTVYSLVNMLMTNLPTLSGVQLLVNGRQADTLAGHVDLRRPLTKRNVLIQDQPTPASDDPARTR